MPRLRSCDVVGATPQASEAERQLVLAEGEKRGWPSAELDAAIQIESGWNPHAYAKSTNAGGLIGFMPFVLRKLGYAGSPEQFRAQSAAQQAPWIGRYFDLIGSRWRRPGDTYLALAASGHVEDPDEREVYPRGSPAWRLNPGWRGKDGRITAGSIRALLLRRMARGSGHAPLRGPIVRRDLAPVIVAGIIVFGLWKGARRVFRW